MHTRGFLIGALLSNVVLGNLCMMPMAMAEDMHDMPGMSHDMPMDHGSDDTGNQGMPCDGGHCLSHALPNGTSPVTTVVTAIAIPVPFSIIQPSFADETPTPTSAAPPGHFIHVKTIVMRN